MQETRTKVIALLKDYHKNQQLIALLNFELAHRTCVSDEEMIEAMNYRRGEPEHARGGRGIDKTPTIALNYRDQAERASNDARSEIVCQLYELSCQQERLEAYIDTMRENDAMILRMTYMDCRSNNEIAKELNCSARTISARRRRAIDALCELYAFTGRTAGGKLIV